MSRIHILVEGQTEETFIRDVVAPHLLAYGVYTHYTILKTKRVLDGPDFAGGVGNKANSYRRFKDDITRLLYDSNIVAVTTFVDFYGLPPDFPGRANLPPGSPYIRVAHVEREIAKDIDNPKFIPYLALHEFESLLFTDPEIMAEMFPEKNSLQALQAIKNQFSSPEEINDSPQTAPSKRISKIFDRTYQKTLHGPLITSIIGLEKIRQECPHFDKWLTALEILGPLK
jgi:hypothetical protein